MNKIKDAPKKAMQHTIYKLADGTRVPGVTTIIGILDKPALKFWANNIGLQGIKISEYVDHLASIGTLAHMMVEDHLTGSKGDYSEYTKDQIDKAENCLISFFEWEKSNKLEVINVEIPLVSEAYRFGGTIDIYGKLNGVKTLIDLKTAKACYNEHFMQVSAYEILMHENMKDVDQVKIVRIGRDETEGFDTYSVEKRDIQKRIFLSCLEIYNLQKLLK